MQLPQHGYSDAETFTLIYHLQHLPKRRRLDKYICRSWKLPSSWLQGMFVTGSFCRVMIYVKLTSRSWYGWNDTPSILSSTQNCSTPCRCFFDTEIWYQLVIRYPRALHRWNVRLRPSPWQQISWEPHLRQLSGESERWLNSLGLCGLGAGRTVVFRLHSSLGRSKTDYVWQLRVQLRSQVRTLYNSCSLHNLPLMPSI
jgi:hypothetical protein